MTGAPASTEPERRRLRLARATLVGGLTGVLITAAATSIFVALAAANSAPMMSRGQTPAVMVLQVLPAVVLVGAIVAFPTAALSVWIASYLGRARDGRFSWVIWMICGVLLSFPIAYAFSTMDAPGDRFELFSLGSFFLATGALSALAAWAARYGKNP